MSASQLLIDLRRQGVRLSLADGRLQVQAPPGVLTPALRDRLKAHRDELTDLLAANDPAAAAGEAPIPRLRDRQDAPLSPAQQRLWLLQQLESDPALYLIPAALELRGALDPDAVRRGIQALMARHESLRTVFRERDGEALAHRLDAWPDPLHWRELAASDDQDAALAQAVAAACADPIDLERGPMLRVHAFALGPQRHVLLLLLHHIAGDAQSMAVLTREFAQAYAAALDGAEPAWEPLPLQYADYAHWQRVRWREGRLDASRDWWVDRLDGLAPLHALTTDRARPERLGNAGARVSLRLDANERAAVLGLAQAHDATVFVVLQAAFALLLKRHGDHADVAFATPVSGREHRELQPLVGFFVNTLAMRHRVEEDASVGAWLAQVKRATLEAFAHQALPFDKLIEAVQPARSLSHAPLLQIMLSYQRREGDGLRLPGLDIRPWPLPQAGSKFELSLDALDGDDGIELSFEYNTELFAPARIAAMAAQLRRLLAQMCADTDAPLRALDMLDAAQRQTLQAWEGEVRVRGERPVLSEIAERAERTPDAIALVDGARTLSYRELLRNVAAAAAALAARGVKAGDLVALRLPRGAAAIECLLACHWLGAGYVPLDTALSQERCAFILADAGCRLLIAEAPVGDAAWIAPAALAEAPNGATTPPRQDALEHPAYAIYTSGSTGRPKGVRISQRNLAGYVRAVAEHYRIEPRDRVLQFASLSFDISVEEIFCALAAGAALVLRDDESVAGPAGFAAFVAAQAISVASLPTAFWHVLCGDPAAAVPADSPLRLLAIGGEAARADCVRAWRRAVGTRLRLLNTYGPTEATVAATCFDLGAGEDVRIGRAYANTRCLVLQGEVRVPEGVPGELVLAGEGVGEGYIGHAAANAAGFAELQGERVYRTGDRVCWRDGELQFLGRRDDQAKVQGFRVEPGEIEPALRGLAGVADACAVCLRDPAGDNRLIAYWQADADVGDATDQAVPDEADLRAALARELPFYLVPSRFVRLPRLPRNVNGKLDRRALPAPDWDAAATPAAALDERETALLALFREVLGQPGFGPDDDFFRAGGHSLAAARLAGLIRTRLQRALPLRELFAAPNVRALAAALEHGEVETTTPQRLSRTQRLPLSPAQRRLWFLQQLDAASPSYNMPGAWRIEGALDAVALRVAFACLLARHEALHSRIASDAGTPYALPDPQAALPWRELDLSALAPAQREARLQQRLHASATAAFDLERELPLRIELIRLGADEHALLVCLHHIAADGASLGLLMAQANAAYRAALRGERDDEDASRLHYADFADWQQRLLTPERERSLLTHWRERLSGAPAVHSLPLDYPRPERPDHRGGHHAFVLPAALVARLDALALDCGVTAFMLLKSAFALVLARYSDNDDIVLGTPVSGRERAEFEHTIGFFANTLVLRETVDRSRSLPDSLRAGRAQYLADFDRQAQPFDTLVEALGSAGQGGPSPLFQILFALHEGGAALEFPDARLVALDHGSGTAKFDLSLHLTRRDGGLHGQFEFAAALLREETVRSLGESLAALLADLAERPDAPAGELALAAAALPQPAPAAAAVAHADLWHWFEHSAQAHAQAVALEHGEHRIEYAELARQARDCADYLYAHGVRAGDRVGLCLARGCAPVVAILACLRLGAAYVPLDPAYPSERLLRIAAEARLRCILADAAGEAALIGADAPRLPMPAADAVFAPAPTAAIDPDSAAYVLYTSGSTGTPKGVVLPHRALTQLLAAQAADQPLFGERLATLQFTSLNFDVSFQEIFTALASGSRLVLVDEAQRQDLPALVELIHTRGVQRLFLPVAVLTLLPMLAQRPLPALRLVAVAGEALSVSPAQRSFFAAHPQCRLVNHYGPTETHVVTAHTLPADPLRWPALPPIGRPLPNLRLSVRDVRGAALPQGAIGELYVAGPALASGYLGRPDLTAERFVVDADGAVAYRTGDRVHLGGDGELRYLSRGDGQIKLRGFRIETGEVAAQLQAVPGVRAAAVDLRNDPAGEPRLVAWLAGDEDAAALRERAERQVERSLPAFMRPQAYAVLARLPLTVNGKLDRAALPAPQWQREPSAAQPAQTATEAVLLELWRELLGNDGLGTTDHFFAHGGHSLLAVRLLARVRERYPHAPPLAAIFAAPTVRELAARIDALADGANADAPVAADRSGELPLSFGQARLWALERLTGGAADYLIPAVVELRGELDAARLLAAFDAVCARHEILRSRFGERDGEGRQTVRPAAAGTGWIEDATGCSDEACRERVAELTARPFDLAEQAPLRVALLRRAADRHVLVLVLHHIVADAASLPILLADLQAAYAEPAQALPALPLQYGDYALWQRGREGQASAAQELAWWRERLHGLPTVHNLPLDRPRPPQRSYAGATLRQPLPPALVARLDALAARQRVSRYVLLQAVFVLWLHHFSEAEDIVLGTPSAARDHAGLDGMIGFFVDTLVLRHRAEPSMRFDQLLDAVAATVTQALAHQDNPFEHLVDALRPPRELAHNPLFQIMFSAQSAQPMRLSLPGIEVHALDAPSRSAKFDLSLDVNQLEDDCVAFWEYATDLFDADSVEQFAAHYLRLLEAVADAPTRTLDELARIEEHWPAPTTAPVPTPVAARIREHALRTPRALAVEDGETRLDYRSLWHRAGALARHLPRDGTPVAVLAPRGWQSIVAELAAWRAARAFLPLDPAHPPAHLQAIAADAGAGALLRHADFALDLGVPGWTIDTASEPEAPDGDDDNDGWADAAGIAYLIYTSGSTGAPKGVVIGHDNLAAYVDAAGAAYAIGAHDRVLNLASPGFDIAIEETMVSLAHGATVVVAGPQFLAQASGFCAALAAQAISVTSLPTALWNVLAETAQGAQAPACWRLCVLGGESLQPGLLAQWRRHVVGGPQLINTYGPTETTVVASHYRLGDDGRVAIGRALGDARLSVRRDGWPVAPGLPGELVIGGAGVGRGYHGQPQLSAEAFFESEGQRWYRSGDRVRWNGEGQLEFLGRSDHQLKLRGYRVDPEQVGAVLADHPALHQAVVVAVRPAQGEAHLAAYAVADPGAASAAVEPAALRQWLAARLPDYMLPQAWSVVPELPLTVNGKLDRKRLPEAPRLAASVTAAAPVAPRDERERELAAIWCELLRLPQVGVEDDFFALGGNSLGAIRLKARVEARFNVELELAGLFARPTIAALAERIAAADQRIAADDIGFLNDLLDELE
ncbi:non-ribosomal peptide synthetase [Lysobacter enzymogenes]|uniref:non-ribosomal peptide synthetase n=1 Tax=Lysobacter enzymogenes TaxID=69 RepID=UPI00099B46C2|nr:non-ribosomal peptide synthetase [Lysobacter enzymogenes]UZW58432.1 non-ribosomal peptide synthetase [Lysobacter enzymogenes]